MPFMTICSHAVETIRPPIVFLVDHRRRLPLDSAMTSAALLALLMTRPIRSGIQPHHAWCLYTVTIAVDELIVDTNAGKSCCNQCGYDAEAVAAVGASYVGSQPAHVTAVFTAVDALVMLGRPEAAVDVKRYATRQFPRLVQHLEKVSIHPRTATRCVG